MTKGFADQHDLMIQTLLDAGGIRAEQFRRAVDEEVADVYFPEENWIVEVKTITHNRFADPRVSQRVGEQLAKDSAIFGGPVPFGRVRVNVGDLPRESGTNVLRILGETLQRALKKANKQIRSTKRRLGRSGTGGCVALVSPFPEMDLGVLGWLANDSLRQGAKEEIDAFILARSSLAAPITAPLADRSAMAFAVRTTLGLPDELRLKIGLSWARIHGHDPKPEFPPDDTINDI